MEGKETRFGIATPRCGQRQPRPLQRFVNACTISFTPLGGLVPMWLIQLGEVIFGGVGSDCTAC
jgi:K+-transporting ATPase ATPase A chain